MAMLTVGAGLDGIHIVSASAVHFTRTAERALILATVSAGDAAGRQQRPADHTTSVQPQQPHALSAT